MLEIKNLYASYGSAKVLHDVSLSVELGKIVSIVGANGVGKSTLLNCISGLVDNVQGSITFENNRIDKLPSHKIVDMGIVQSPEGSRLFPHLTVRENLELGAVNPHARKHRDKNLEYIFSILPRVKEREKQLAGTLSGGERQMVAIGRALMSEPKLLMMDEPSLGLAPIIVQEIFKLIKKINSDGTTVILVEQNVQHALELSDYGYVLEHGSVVLEGKGHDLLENSELKKAYFGM